MTSDFFDYDGKPAELRNGPRTLFSRFHDGDWKTITEFGAILRYPGGATVFTSEATEASMFFLTTGTLKLQASNPGAFESASVELGPGSVFGLLSFLDGKPRGARAVAQTSIETIMLEKAMFERLAAWHPRIALVILQDLAETAALRLRQFDTLL